MKAPADAVRVRVEAVGPLAANAVLLAAGDGEELRVGALRARRRHLPGHAPGHVVFLTDAAGAQRSQPER